jgi:hypothetical protein
MSARPGPSGGYHASDIPTGISSSPCRLKLESQRLVWVEHNAAEMSRPSAPVFFSIGAAVDFVFGLVKWHSIVAGIVGIVCGLPLTGLLYLSFRARKGDDNSDI